MIFSRSRSNTDRIEALERSMAELVKENQALKRRCDSLARSVSSLRLFASRLGTKIEAMREAEKHQGKAR